MFRCGQMPVSGPSRRRAELGFTLMELLIASTLLLTAMGLTMSLLQGYTRTSNRAIALSSLEEEQRNALSKLEKELAGASKVLASYTDGSTTYTTDADTLVVEIPIYGPSGFIVTDSNGVPRKDIVAVEVVENPDDKFKLNLRNPAVRSRMLRMSVFPSVDSKRPAIRNQVILKRLMPKNTADDNYSYPAALTAVNPTPSPAPVFSYSDKYWNPATNMDFTAEIAIHLWNETEYSRQQITANKEFEVRLRNFYNTATPGP